ncbi:alkaline phosphatase family protein [Sphingobacteriales bacterium UPWRP_1]|nr:hypothetical protein BVG80_10350 [Sphingobacteriales bacterium TSM_CSM]PSJ78819.1 alkaline phosphatase family protein [Sphingobacteriales bacterium UPWRP_1]
MTYFYLFQLILLCCTPQLLSAQQTGLLVSGPMLGYAEHREALIWLEVSPQVTSVKVQYAEKGSLVAEQKTVAYEGKLQQTFNPVKIILTGLSMNSTYEYAVLLNGVVQKLPYPLTFTTKKLWEWRQDPPAFSFMFGSCAYVNDSVYDRPGVPYGQNPAIFESMTKQSSDFMLWVGDNVYLREADWSSAYGIQYRYQHVRKLPQLQPFFASRPQYATWDDHDYGPNDSNFSYELKDVTLQTFINYWGNKSYGEDGNKGVYGKFTWADAEFFLLDDRYYRWHEAMPDSLPEKAYLGQRQLQWLQNALLSSTATFKFIVSGSQMLNPLNNFECFTHYTREYNQLIGFITKNKVKGVLFLSGDRHLTEIIKVQSNGFYPLYDITSSPLTSRPYTSVFKDKEGNNPNRVPNTLVAEQNYVHIAFSGKRKERIMTISCYNANNEKKWSLDIKQSDLGY